MGIVVTAKYATLVLERCSRARQRSQIRWYIGSRKQTGGTDKVVKSVECLLAFFIFFRV